MGWTYADEAVDSYYVSYTDSTTSIVRNHLGNGREDEAKLGRRNHSILRQCYGHKERYTSGQRRLPMARQHVLFRYVRAVEQENTNC